MLIPRRHSGQFAIVSSTPRTAATASSGERLAAAHGGAEKGRSRHADAAIAHPAVLLAFANRAGFLQSTDRPAAHVRIAGRLSFVISIEIAPTPDDSLRPSSFGGRIRNCVMPLFHASVALCKHWTARRNHFCAGPFFPITIASEKVSWPRVRNLITGGPVPAGVLLVHPRRPFLAQRMSACRFRKARWRDEDAASDADEISEETGALLGHLKPLGDIRQRGERVTAFASKAISTRCRQEQTFESNGRKN